MEKETHYQGNDIILVRQLEVDGTLVNLTNYQMRLGISANLEDLSGSKTPTYITNDFPINSTLTNSTTRSMQISDTISQNIPVGNYFYEIQIVDPNNNVNTVELGCFELKARVIE